MRLFPQITPMNVWDVPLYLWEEMAAVCDRWVEDQERGSRG